MRTVRVNDTHYTDISWHDDALAYAKEFGMDPADVEKIVLSRALPKVDARSHEVGHLVMRYHAGDVVVVVGHREKQHPVVMSVWVETGKHRSGSQKPGGAGSSLPKTMKELNKRVLADGFKLVMGGSHMRVEDKDGVLIASLPTTPSEYRTIANTWKYYQRAKAKYHQNKKEA